MISNLPVVIVEKNKLINIVDNSILDNIENILYGKFLEEDNKKIYDYRFKIIPYSSLGNKDGVMLGFKPDYVKIYKDEYFLEKEAIVGIYTESLCNNSDEYSAIIGL